MMKKRSKVFSDATQTLPYNTNVVATICTEDNNPVYSKAYPHPMGVAEFVNKEIKELLKSNIITPSRSPYNNPTLVVDKKESDETGGRKMRLVIDFRKLNEKTIPDKYSLPSIELILANLGNAKYFSALDLKSGYHQIFLAEQDREKNSFSVNGGKIGNKSRHIIHFTEKSTLFETLRSIINPKVVNAIHCNLPTLASIQHALVSNFPATKFWHC
ncbi:hypothetical protein KR026_002304, partial [Drosophila bipectinata]